MTIHERLFAYYKIIQLKEIQESIVSWEPIRMKNTKVAIRINFKKNWIRALLNGIKNKIG